MKIRYEQSYENSRNVSDAQDLESSIDSINIIDESVSKQIYSLHLEEEARFQSPKTFGTMTKSLIFSKEESICSRIKSQSVIYSSKKLVSLQNMPIHSMNQLLSYNRCPMVTKDSVQDRAFGAMFGFLIGDSLGSSLMNRRCSQEQILDTLMMKGGGLLNLMPGQGSDQWEICLSLCQGLIDCKGVYNANKIGRKYLEWIESSPCDLPVLMAIPFQSIKKGKHSRRIDMDTIGHKLRQGSIKNMNHESVLGLIRIIPLAIWGLDLQEHQFNLLIKCIPCFILEQMRLITPNEFVVETSIVFANILKTIIKTGDHELAYEQAQGHVFRLGSQKMVDLWNNIIQNYEPQMKLSNCNNLKFPFLYAINEIIKIDKQSKDLRKSFIESAMLVLSKGFNTDTNCSIVLGLLGATIGYNNIPSYYRTRVASAQTSKGFRTRSRDYSSKRIVNAVTNLLNNRAKPLESYFDWD